MCLLCGTEGIFTSVSASSQRFKGLTNIVSLTSKTINVVEIIFCIMPNTLSCLLNHQRFSYVSTRVFIVCSVVKVGRVA